MARDRDPEGTWELTAWLEADDKKGRTARARRLRELLAVLPAPEEGVSHVGGEESVICFNEVRRCYVDGSYLATVLLCLAYVERELAAGLYAEGWEDAKSAQLGRVLKKAHEDGMLSGVEWQTYREVAKLRNSHAHFRPPGSPESLIARVVHENALPMEVLAKDARCAIQAMARVVRRQSGFRVALGPPDD